MPTPPLFFLVGPTAVGKTDLAAEVALLSDYEIISADAFQVYQGLDILTAKPSRQVLEKVPHHLIGIIPPSEAFDVAQFQAAALEAASEIHGRGKFPLVVGGTGLYVRALTHGLAELPKADPKIRTELELLSLEELKRRYQSLDPEGAAQIDSKNPRRLIRALEVCLITGEPFSKFRKEWEKPNPSIAGVFLNRDREMLYERIDRRTLEMFKDGVLEEVAQVGPVGRTASQVIGFTECREHLAGELSIDEAIQRIQQATRRYAKRQLTWFKRETHFTRVNIDEQTSINQISHILRSNINNSRK